jgi:hypothetical protein
MTISLLLKRATGALFLNEGGTSNDLDGVALQGFVDFAPCGDGRGAPIRLEGTARIAPMHGPGLRYGLSFGRSLAGFMILDGGKRNVTDPDYKGFVGASDELVVSGWNRSLNGRCYVLLNVRENPAAVAVRQLSSI